ncbi:MAG: hypothetical protein ACREA0_20005 [bacterium]
MPKRLFLQVAAATGAGVLSGALLLGSGIAALSDARTAISPDFTYWGTAVVAVCALSADLLLRVYPQPWPSGQRVRTVKGLSAVVWAPIIGAVALLWVPRVLDWSRTESNRPEDFFPIHVGTSWSYQFGALDTAEGAPPRIKSVVGRYTESVVAVNSLLGPEVMIVGVQRSGKPPASAPCAHNPRSEAVEGDPDFWYVADSQHLFYSCDRLHAVDIADRDPDAP